jgi:hypothetical protein
MSFLDLIVDVPDAFLGSGSSSGRSSSQSEPWGYGTDPYDGKRKPPEFFHSEQAKRGSPRSRDDCGW